MGDLFLPTVLLQPLIETLRNDNTPLAFFHRGPHPTVPHQRVITSIDCPHDRAVVGVTLGPEWHKPYRRVSVIILGTMPADHESPLPTPLHRLKFIPGLFGILNLRRSCTLGR